MGEGGLGGSGMCEGWMEGGFRNGWMGGLWNGWMGVLRNGWVRDCWARDGWVAKVDNGFEQI